MQMNKQQIMYNEVYEFLNILGEKYIGKIPKPLYNFIREEKLDEYNNVLDEKKDISEQLSEEALDFIAYLNLMYWCSAEEKQELIRIYSENDKKEEELKREKYNPDKLFESKTKRINEEKSMVIYKESLLRKIINRIKQLFIDKRILRTLILHTC